MLARKARVIPFECVARGYLAGSGYREYQAERHGLRHPAPPGPPAGEPAARSRSSPRPPRPRQGHDENVDFATVEARRSERSLAAALRDLTLDLYQPGRRARRRAAT